MNTRILQILFCGLLASCAAQNETQKSTYLVSAAQESSFSEISEKQVISPLNTCLSGDAKLSMEWLEILSNDVVRIEDLPDQQLRISRNTALLEKRGESGAVFRDFLVPVIVSEILNDEYVDFDLYHAYLGGERYLYWRETLKYTAYRQGLLKLYEDTAGYYSVRSYCVGKGGIASSH